jgi:hypothetical protein
LVELLHQGAKLHEVFESGNPAKRKLDQEACVWAAAKPAPRLGKDLERGEDGVEVHRVGDGLEARQRTGRGTEKVGRRAGREHHHVAEKLEGTVQEVSGLDAAGERLVEDAERAIGLMLGEGFEQIKDALVGREAEGFVDYLCGELRVAVGKEPLEQ